MKFATVGIILLIHVCSYSIADAAEYKGNCEEDANCTDTGQKCLNGVCDCYADNNYSYDGAKCVKKLGTGCSNTSECNDEAVFCDTNCKCNTSTHYDNNGSGTGGSCIAKHGLDVNCTNPGTSGAGVDQCTTENAICKFVMGNNPPEYECQCDTNYREDGILCVTDQCASNPCQNEGTCISNSNSYTCTCSGGYTGTNCESDHCATNSCQNGGACISISNGYTCTCSAGYTGANCGTDKDECQQSSDNNCDVNAVCSNTEGNYTCTCKAGYTGDGRTCQDKDECQQSSDNNCDVNAVCSNTEGSYTCTCKAGYTGDGRTCRDKDECQQSSDNNCDVNAVCSNTEGSYTCTCKAGYTGDGRTCQGIYLGSSCNSFANCVLVDNSECGNSVCSCKSGYFQSGTGSLGTCTKRSLGDQCTDTSQCTDQFTECKSVSGTLKCECQSGYYNDGSTCSKRSIGQQCSDTSQCNYNNAECKSNGNMLTCVCQSGYYNDGSTCSKRSLGQQCSDTSQCNYNNAECKSNGNMLTCVCQSGYYNDGSTCSKSRLGEPCTATSQCSAGNAVCGSGCKCQCPSTHYDSDGSELGGSCNLKVSLGGGCPQPTSNVPDSATCSDYYARCLGSGSSYTCRCVSTRYDNMVSTDRKCVQKVELGYSCPRFDACVSEHASCVGENCVCDSEYFDDNGLTLRGTCVVRKSLGAICTGNPSVISKQCKDQNAACSLDSGSYKCTCNTGYHQEGSSCVANKALGETCNSASTEVECSDPAAICIADKCTCNNDSYDSNGLSLRGTCDPMTNLQVTNVGFTSIQTSQITVSWSAPQNYKQYIDGYTVQWKLTNDNGIDVESENLGSSATTLILTKGIDPGRAYSVTIFSNNEQTQQGSLRSTSVTKYQAAKPGKTTGIDSSNSDRDTDGGTIKVSWFDPNGYESGYNVKLIDGTNEFTPYSISTSNQNALFQSSVLKNGYRYNVTIQAKSETFNNGKTVQGEIFTTEFKTTPKIPDPPQNGMCKDSTDGSITLTWAAPTVPNGDLVRYHIQVYKDSAIFKHASTTGTEIELKVEGLAPGTSYVFLIYTENEKGNSSRYDTVSSGCKTRARMSEAPTSLEITEVTSRGFDISWNKPENTFSAENYGYVLQIKEQDTCVKEIIYKCSDCKGGFQILDLNGLCESTLRTMEEKTKLELDRQLTYSAILNPDITYTVTVTVISDAGRGHPASKTETTNEEAPQAPENLAVSEIRTTSMKVSWNIGTPRPGITNFTIILRADSPAQTREFTVTGYDTRVYMAKGLEEYWNYSVIVTAATSVGTKSSVETREYRTLPAAPGKVSEFKIEKAPGGIYTQMKVTWQAPYILDRNSIIKGYSFEYYATGRVPTTQNFWHESSQQHVYTVILPVTPEEAYTLAVYALNTYDQKGENITRQQVATSGVPLNIEETLQVEIIPVQRMKHVGERHFTVSVLLEFFEESTNGQIQASGLVACATDCSFEGIETLLDFNSMDSWTKSSQKGYTLYRITKPTWRDQLKTQSSVGRRKRDVMYVEYTVGSDDCTNTSPGEYCNGPLQPGTSYYLVAVTCTNGGCLSSREYGPFVTASAEPSTEECNCSSQLMITGVVLGLIILILIVYAGYITFLFRRYRQKDGQEIKSTRENDRKSQTYVNESFVVGVADTAGNTNVRTVSNRASGEESESEYSRLDDKTREDKSTYDIIQPRCQF